jgi:Kef-type K+ transport system membrane component KefB
MVTSRPVASFGQLTMLILAGVLGPLLAASRKVIIPVVVGELIAGVALGKTGAGIIKADNQTIAFLGNVGFAMLMMVAGMHVPLRNRALLGTLRRGFVAVLITAAFGAAGGFAIAHALSLGHPAIWAILLSTGSAAIVLPALEEGGVGADVALLAMAWATVADVATIVPVPLVMNPSKAVRAGLGAVAVIAAGGVVWVIARFLAKQPVVHGLRGESAPKAWALDLRISLVALFALCALAEQIGTSIMIAGFAAGLVVAAEGGPPRLNDQMSGVAQGFLVPVFFVVLGASLNVRSLVQSGKALELAAALIVGLTATHVITARLMKLPFSTGLIVSAQLGVPASVAKIGLASHVLQPGQAAAVVVAALASLGLTGAGVTLAKRSSSHPSPAPGAVPQASPPQGPDPPGAGEPAGASA